MAVPLPDWIQVNPRDFASAAEAGSRLGLERRGQNIQLSDIATNAALKQQQLRQASQQAGMEAANAAAAHNQEYQLSSQQLALDAAMKQQAFGLEKARLDQDTLQAAQKFQAQQQYQQLVSGGMDPVQAALQVGPGLLGESVSGLGSLKRADELNKFKPTEYTTPAGTDMVQESPGRWVPAKIPPEWQDTTRTVGDTEIPGQENTVTKEFRAYPGQAKPPTDLQKENMVLKLQTDRQKLLDSNDIYAERLEAGDGADSSWSKDEQAKYNAVKRQLKQYDDAISKYSGDSVGSPSTAQFRYNPQTRQIEPVADTSQSDMQ